MRLERQVGTPEPGQTVLLSAGPGAGKTWTLRRWQRSLGLPAVYLRLTPEDRDPGVLRHRLLRLLGPHLPEPSASAAEWGAGLGLLRSALAILVDDWHALEGSESAAHLASFLWSLPHGSIVALASRHRFDDALALAAVRWPLDDPMRPEQPSLADLSALPPALRDLTLALGLVGEAPPSPEGLELVRRNVACEGDGDRLALRPAWAKLASKALPPMAASGTWDAVEGLLAAFAERHRWTQRDHEVAALLARVPPAERASRPGLLALEARQHYQEGAYGEAIDCCDQALRLKPRDPDLVFWRALALVWCELRGGGGDPRAAWEHVATLEGLASESASARTLAYFLRAYLHWYDGNFAEAEVALRALLALPVDGDRSRAHYHLWAMLYLCELSSTQLDLSAAYELMRRMADWAARWNLDEHLPPLSVLARQKLAQLDQTRLSAQEHLADVPNALCAGAPRTWLANYLYNLAEHARASGEPELALRLLRLCEQQSRNVLEEGYMAQLLRKAQIAALMDLGRLAEVEERQAALLSRLSGGPQHDKVRLEWARSHLARRDPAAAREALRECAPEAPTLRRRHHLYAEAVLFLEGDAEALERLRAWLETPEGAPMVAIELKLLQELGLGTAPIAGRLSAFGPLQFHGEGGKPIRWVRRKAMLLLAHLVLRPEGIPSAELAERFRGDDETGTSPAQALSLIVHALRQALKGIGLEALLDTSQGVVRLDRAKLAFCDLVEFDAFYERARSFEADGYHQMAAVFFSIALCHARGELFENLPEDFAEPRIAYRQRVRYAQAYVIRQAPATL